MSDPVVLHPGWKTAPGSDAAQHQGCRCPVIDNGYGRGYMGGGIYDGDGYTIFVVVVGCPHHSMEQAA